jgi:pyruvate formate lyase activating enzyme
LGGTAKSGILEWYYDPLPTNCVGSWVCPGGIVSGSIKNSKMSSGTEVGYKNLAVFYGACTFDCLFCQNWHYRYLSQELSPVVTAQELASKVDSKTSCICFFGGYPTPQVSHALKASKLALENRSEDENSITRICWESNGSMARNNLKKVLELSATTGGCIKFDLKFWHDELNYALCGVSNHQTLDNFEYLAGEIESSPIQPLIIASTLLVPGYIGPEEIRSISKFISSLNPDIPYSLLAFHPQFEMEDMPVTNKKEALLCLEAAKEGGLNNVNIGNLHLLE